MNPVLDHVMIGVPDLDGGLEWFQDRTGVKPKRGGAHAGLGTHNALVSFGPDTYLEIIATDPENPVSSELSRQLALIERPTPLGWCFSCPDADVTVSELEAKGVLCTVVPISRREPDGSELSWRVILPQHDLGPAIPFLIDWNATPTPASTSPKGCALRTVTPTHPETARAQTFLDLLGVRAEVMPAEKSGLRLELQPETGSAFEVVP